LFTDEGPTGEAQAQQSRHEYQAFAKVYTDPAISTGRELERSAAAWPSLIPGSAVAELALDRPFQKLPASAGTSRRAPML
jgi:hypothetical protein